MAGPYLKLDLLARHLRRRGDRAAYIFGSDIYETFVMLRAELDGVAPRAVCDRFHPLMKEDLAALRIECEYFYPFEPRFHDRFDAIHLEVMRRLVSRRTVVPVRERLPYNPRRQRFELGYALLGNCPHCGSGAGSYYCEECGYHFQPELMSCAHSRFGDDLEWRDVECLFLRIADVGRLTELIAAMGVPDVFKDICAAYLTKQGAKIRLTVPGAWGLPWDAAPGGPQILYSYPFLFAFYLMCGERYGELTGTRENPFALDSAVTTISAFGIDNTIPMMVGVLGAAISHAGYKPFDHYLGNHFCNLEGSKFSTSREHAIWAADIVRKTPIASDSVRYYLTKMNPEHAPTSFSLHDLVATTNTSLAGALQQAIGHAAAAWVGEPGAAPQGLLERLDALLASQGAALDPRRFQMAETVRALDAWVAEHRELTAAGASAYWWLKGLSLLASPILPDMAIALWRQLGHDGEPATAELTRPRPTGPGPAGFVPPTFFSPIQLSQLVPCLPDSLRGAFP